MALWIDDTLSEQERWWGMSTAARTCLIELWLYCRRSRNDGVIATQRLHRASDAFSAEVYDELITNRWCHKDASGCGSDTCPKGAEGFTVMHDYLEHQESASDMSNRIERQRQKKREGKARAATWRDTHEPKRDDKGRIVGWVEK